MKKYKHVWIISVGLIAAVILVMLISTSTLSATETILLEDDFDGGFDTSKWEFFTNGSGTSATVSNGWLIVDGGVTDGGGGWVLSKQKYTPIADTFVLEMRVRVSVMDGGWWGMMGDYKTGIASFATGQDGYFTTGVHNAHPDTGPGEFVVLTGINTEDWHTYRIEITGLTSNHYIDDTLVASFSEKVPHGMPMNIRLDRVSWGEHRYLYVDYVKLSVLSNQAPVADAGGPYSGDEGALISLDTASASDPDDDILTCAWSVNSPLCTFSDSSLLNPTIICNDNGIYTATLTVSDGVSDPVSSDAEVFINNIAPVVNAGMDTVIYNLETLTINASFTDSGMQDIHTATIDWGEGAGHQSASVNQSEGSGNITGSHNYPGVGFYTVEVCVTDDDGDTGCDSFELEVQTSLTIDHPSITVDEGQTATNSGEIFLSPSQTFDFYQHTIADSFDEAQTVYGIDLDQDGDIDVLGAANSDNEIAWWENDGNENFEKHSIDYLYDAYDVIGIDMDGDADIDVLATGYYADEISWWENDGNENFTKHLIAQSYDGAATVFAIDLDEDSDMDVLCAALYGDEIAWWENDGNENFTKHTVASFNGAVSVYAIDLDGDTDIDIIGAGDNANEIAWWENDGNENFTKNSINPNYSGAWEVFCVDVDSDGDIDIVGASRGVGKVSWWENDGSENFTEYTVDDNFGGAWNVFPIDFDQDGDTDILGAAALGHLDLWENDGNENFIEHIISNSFDGAVSVFSIDVDNDGDLDVLGAAREADDIAWWENLGEPEYGEVTITSTIGTVSNIGDGTWIWNFDTMDGPSQSQTVTITASVNSVSTHVDFNLVVNNIAPNVETPIVDPGPSDEGASVNVSATFSDPAAVLDMPYTCTINYGDGSGNMTGSINGFTCTGLAYSYADNGAYTVTVSVTDKDGDIGSANVGYIVNNIAPTVDTSSVNPEPSDEGSLVTVSANFDDPAGNLDSPYACTINYGDGSGDMAGLIDGFTCTGPAYSYADNGLYPVTVRVMDKDGDTGSTTVGHMVNNVAPSITILNLDVYSINEGETVTLSGEFIDPGSLDSHTVFIDWMDDSSDTLQFSEGERSFSISHQYLDDDPSGTSYDEYPITVTITDNDGASGSNFVTLTVYNLDPLLGEIIAPIDPTPVNTEISASVVFTDPGILDTHTAVWDWGDDSSSAGLVVESDGSGTVTGSHIYDTPGVYTVSVTFTDDDGGSAVSVFQYVVVYDPDGGFVTGGGWFISPEGAYYPDPNLTGKATFGFVSKYKKGTTIPTGNTEFQLKVADLNFHSTEYQWLVVAGPKAMFKGVGTINGQGNYGFMISAVDEALTPSTDVDLFRIKIWDIDNGDVVIYDNMLGADDDADPTTAIGGGSIVIHKGK